MSQELIKIVEDSFLSRDAKNECIQILNSEGLEAFYKKFATLVLEELKKKESLTKKTVDSLDEEMGKIEARFEEEKSAIDARLAKELESVDPFDIEKKSVVWDVYYKELEKIEKKQESDIKNISAKAVLLLS